MGKTIRCNILEFVRACVMLLTRVLAVVALIVGSVALGLSFHRSTTLQDISGTYNMYQNDIQLANDVIVMGGGGNARLTRTFTRDFQFDTHNGTNINYIKDQVIYLVEGKTPKGNAIQEFAMTYMNDGQQIVDIVSTSARGGTKECRLERRGKIRCILKRDGEYPRLGVVELHQI